MYFEAYAHSLRSLKYIIDDWNYLSVSVDGIMITKKPESKNMLLENLPLRILWSFL